MQILRYIYYISKIMHHISFLDGFFNEKFRLIDWRWSVWRAGGVHNKVKVLVKVLFSDNNSDAYEWN